MSNQKLFTAVWVVACVMILGAGLAFAKLDNSIIATSQQLFPTSDVTFNSVTAPTVTVSTSLTGTGVTNAVASGFATAYNATSTKNKAFTFSDGLTVTGTLGVSGVASSTGLTINGILTANSAGNATTSRFTIGTSTTGGLHIIPGSITGSPTTTLEAF